MARADDFQGPDLTGITKRAADEHHWTDDQMTKAEKWYVAFLRSVHRNPGGVTYVVTEEADQLWHTHITFTRRYSQYCHAILGFYLDHTPLLYPLKASDEDVKAAKNVYKDLVEEWEDIEHDFIRPCWL